MLTFKKDFDAGVYFILPYQVLECYIRWSNCSCLFQGFAFLYNILHRPSYTVILFLLFWLMCFIQHNLCLFSNVSIYLLML